GFGEALGVANTDILRSAVRVVHQTAAMNGPPFVQGLLESVEHKARMRCPAHPPADDAAGVGVDDEGHVDEARPCADVGEVRKPEPVRSRRVEDPIHMVAWTWRGLVLHRRADRLATN